MRNLVLVGKTTKPGSSRSAGPVADHFRCYPAIQQEFATADTLGDSPGFFRFDSTVCYGRSTGETSSVVNGYLFDASRDIRHGESKIVLPFSVEEVLDNLRYERYVKASGRQQWMQKSWIRDIYYSLRPMFPVSFRKHLQRIYLQDRSAIQFPNWPVDLTVDRLFEKLLLLAMQALTIERIPFIWFWPEGRQSCAIVTHDVETLSGRNFCDRLMDIDDSRGIKTSFQIVPEKRYDVPLSYLQSIRDRNFEVNVHGLDHDGNLFRDRKKFLEDAKEINRYAKEFGARGFRSPSLYRNTDWFQDLDFSYDMSVPNAARLEPQSGGCCTVMPYFLPGGMTELPVTTTEDYSLFHILNDYSGKVWKHELQTIQAAHGLMSFIIHPDYIIENRAQDAYKLLLDDIAGLRSDRAVWVTEPREVDRWWRERRDMRLVPDGQYWEIEGTGSARARVAYALRDGDRLAYELD